MLICHLKSQTNELIDHERAIGFPYYLLLVATFYCLLNVKWKRPGNEVDEITMLNVPF